MACQEFAVNSKVKKDTSVTKPLVYDSHHLNSRQLKLKCAALYKTHIVIHCNSETILTFVIECFGYVSLNIFLF